MLEFVSADCVECSLKATSKRQVLETLAKRAEAIAGLDHEAVFAALMEREKLGSTAMGDGIAIPHARLPDLERVVGIFARLSKPIDFDAIDDKPVDIVFLLLAPDHAGAEHLNALAKVARALRNKRICQELRHASSWDAALNLLNIAEEAGHAA